MKMCLIPVTHMVVIILVATTVAACQSHDVMKRSASQSNNIVSKNIITETINSPE